MNPSRPLDDLVDSRARADALAATCHACGGSGLTAFYEVSRIPVQTCVLLDTRSDALAFPTGDLLLGFCESCGFIQNVRFDPSKVDYSLPTEESQAYSPRFQAFAEELADRLVTGYDLQGRPVLEIGCGKGDFLSLLVDRGVGPGVGIDPGYLANRRHPSELLFVREAFRADHVHPADLVLTRHVLEHIADVSGFFDLLAAATRRTAGAALFTEVPDVLRVLVEGAFWDVYYEHCSYFTPGTLAASVRRCGFGVTSLEMAFDGQYILAGGAPDADDETFDAEESRDVLRSRVVQFGAGAAASVLRWQSRIAEARADGPVVIWGGGSKAVAFLTSLGAEVADSEDLVVVDINPHKQGRWLPTVGAVVQDPSVLGSLAPSLVIPMNAIYVDEIRADLHAMGLRTPIEAL